MVLNIIIVAMATAEHFSEYNKSLLVCYPSFGLEKKCFSDPTTYHLWIK